jgi:HTH-type transcriptional regulator, sugar sensing transcriptional regulator
MDVVSRAVTQLTALGFSEYEARAYVGLLGGEPMSSAALARRTRIPLAEIDETLRLLEDREAVLRAGGDPVTFVAAPAERLVATLSEQGLNRVTETEWSFGEASSGQPSHHAHVLPALAGWHEVATWAEEALARAERHVYLSTDADHLFRFASIIDHAQDRGVRFDILCFGKSLLSLRNGRLLQHEITNGIVDRHDQASHLALVVDNHDVLWALAPDGGQWEAAVAIDPLFVALVKGYIRQNLHVQQMYDDFPDELASRYDHSTQPWG